MKLMLSVIACSVAFAAAASAQAPTVAAVLNAASYGQPGMPNEGVAQGSIATAFGTNLGPVRGNYQGSLPLPKIWEGVSVQITVGGTTVDAYPIQLAGTQVSFVVPSNTPVGDGTVTISVNGTPGTGPIKVVANNLGIFSQNYSGQGLGVIDDPNYNRHKLTYSARPGQVVIIWATGLGAVQGAADNVTSGNLTNIPIEVWIGGQKVPDDQVQYRGRTSCCVGVDQINVVVPQNVSGCNVPVVIKAGQVVSNNVSLSIAPNGGTCSDPGNVFTPAILNQAQASGRMRLGALGLGRMVSYDSSSGQTMTMDMGSATFMNYTWDNFSADADEYGYQQFGSCIVETYRTDLTNPGGTFNWTGLDAGPSIGLTGPKGARTLTKVAFPGFEGFYSAQLGGAATMPPSDPYLDPGTYTFTGPGGAQVGAFNKVLNLPAALTWTNMQQTNTVNRAAGVEVIWTGGDPNGYTIISGEESAAAPLGSMTRTGASFTCWARTSAGRFTVPSIVLLALPASPAGEGSGSLSVSSYGDWNNANTFTASGIDLGIVSAYYYNGRDVRYQ